MQLYLQMRAGDQGYLLETDHIDRVLPLMRIRGVPGAAGGVTGLINYQGLPVPVLDLCELLLRRPAVRQVSTRLILLSVSSFPAAERVCPHGLVALLAEGVNGVIRLAPSDFIASAGTASAPWLGPMTSRGGSLLQRIELAWILSTDGLAVFRLASSTAA